MNLLNDKLFNKILIPNKSGMLNKSICEKKSLANKIYNILVENNNYETKIRSHFIISIPKKIKSSYKIVVAHIDNVYKKTFIKKYNDYYVGTFDNSLGLYTSLKLYNDNYENVIFAYTDCEETSLDGIKNLIKFINKNHTINIEEFIILDVTEEKINCSTTIENSNLKLQNFNIGDIIRIDNKSCGYDESKYILENTNYKTCSVCAVLKMRNSKDFCHNENGNYIIENNIEKYYNNVQKILENVYE